MRALHTNRFSTCIISWKNVATRKLNVFVICNRKKNHSIPQNKNNIQNDTAFNKENRTNNTEYYLTYTIYKWSNLFK